MARPKEFESDPIKFHLDQDLVSWLDAECERRERSRSYVLSEIVRFRKRALEARRVDHGKIRKTGSDKSASRG